MKELLKYGDHDLAAGVYTVHRTIHILPNESLKNAINDAIREGKVEYEPRPEADPLI